MITGPLYVKQMERGHYQLQCQLTVSDRLYRIPSRVHWRGITPPTQKQIRKMRKISFFIRKYPQHGSTWVWNNKDIDEALEEIRLYKMGEKEYA